MSKRVKSFGPANDDGVPVAEMVLAKLLQSAGARGLELATSVQYRDEIGNPCGPKDARSACAFGAWFLDENGPMPAGLANYSVAYGNDGADPSGTDSEGYTLGAAYRDAMSP